MFSFNCSSLFDSSPFEAFSDLIFLALRVLILLRHNFNENMPRINVDFSRNIFDAVKHFLWQLPFNDVKAEASFVPYVGLHATISSYKSVF